MISCDELLDILKDGHAEDIAAFDVSFEKETSRFVKHMHRTLASLERILIQRDVSDPIQYHASGTYLWEGANSLIAAFGLLRRGFPLQSLDLARRLIETTCVAVYIQEHPSIVTNPRFTKLSPSRCVTYAKRHLPNVGRIYGLFTAFDHAHSTMLSVTRVKGSPQLIGYSVGPSSVSERPGFFRFATALLLSEAHNIEGVTEMLFFRALESTKHFWIPDNDLGAIVYQPTPEELECERETSEMLNASISLLESESVGFAQNDLPKREPSP